MSLTRIAMLSHVMVLTSYTNDLVNHSLINYNARGTHPDIFLLANDYVMFSVVVACHIMRSNVGSLSLTDP